MLTRLFTAAFLAAVLAVPAPAAAQGLSLSGPSLSLSDVVLPGLSVPARQSVTVRIDNRPRPDASLVKDGSKWVVVARSPAHPGGQQVSIREVRPTDLYDAAGLIRIIFTQPVGADVHAVDIVSLTGKPTRVTWSQRKPAGSLGIFPVEKRDKADVYLFGSWVAGPDISPTYNVDLSLGAPITDFKWSGSDYRLSASFTMKSSERRDVDPDSYLLSAKVGRIYPIDLDDAGPYLDVQWETVRLEFSRKDSFSNFVTAPAVTYSRALLVSLTGEGLVRAAIDAEVLGALEIGANMSSKGLPEGYGAIVRFVPGLAVYAAFPGALGLEEVRWTSTYRARILAAREPYSDLRDDDNPFPSLARGTRHEWKDQLDFKVTPLLSLAVTHEFGSTPPAFKILDHRFTLGVTAMWAWKK